MKLIECVPNFSEGRDMTVVTAIRDAIAAVEGVSVLHVTADASHNRSVITFVAPYETAVDAAFAGIRVARERIDLTTHRGEHPRIGAADVVPFIPLDGARMDDCIMLAYLLGERVGQELEIPVYLYERAARHPSRQNLADLRRGGFEVLREEIGVNPARAPDYGPGRVHPTAGAVVIGARPFLVAFNVYIGGAEYLATAKQIARAVRASSGGLPFVKALGLEVDGQAQVSMNLVDVEQMPLSTVFDAVRREARARGVDVTWSEIIGLVPERVLFETAAAHLRLRQPVEEHVLERRVLEALGRERTVGGYLEAVASSAPTPGGGSVAAYVGALGAALGRMVARLTDTSGTDSEDTIDIVVRVAYEAQELATRLETLADRDSAAYDAVVRAYALPKRTDEERVARAQAVRAALLTAARVPLETARLCGQVVQLTETLAERGKRSAISDVGTAAAIAEAACRGAAYNVRINVQGLGETADGSELVQEAQTVVSAAAQHAARVATLVEKALAGRHS